ncbi:hypothetical protein FOA52_011039 [Chlamydomonas sp. UWO 241]|nr:hypothetical protein FOA52_011039 [Chlamydomonas sp. UWO 241]
MNWMGSAAADGAKAGQAVLQAKLAGMPEGSAGVNGEPEASPSSQRSGEESSLSLEEIKLRLRTFARERDWDQFHTPRNLVLALVGEVGELAECFQWKGEVADGLPEFTEKEKVHVAEELSDCLMYLLRLSDKCGVDLARSVTDKMDKNATKYPADVVRGSSKKYTEYKQAARAASPSREEAAP